MSDYRTLETDRLEIVLIAAGVLVLVSVLGILILLGVGLKSPSPGQDAESCQRFTAWGGTLDEQQRRATEPVECYRDEDETFVSCVRRKSQILADELRRELISLKRGFTMSGALPAERQPKEPGVADNLRNFSLDCIISPLRRESDPELPCEIGPDYIVSPMSPVSATGRDDEADTTRRRQSRPAKKMSEGDLEAQCTGDSLL